MRKKLLFICVLFIHFHGFAQSWKKLNPGVSTSISFIGVCAPSPTVCYVSGSGGTILKTTDGGTTWVSQTTGVTDDIYALTFTDVNTGYAVGNAGIALKTINGGTNWTSMTVPSGDHRNVWFENMTTGYIAGGTNAGGDVGTMFKTTDAGANWTRIGVPSTSLGVYSIAFTSSTVGYTADFNGNVHKTTNAGVSWTTQNITSQPLNGGMIFLTPSKGFVVGYNGTIKTTNDAGATWTTSPSGNTTADYVGIDFYDANHGCIVGGTLNTDVYSMLTTSDGGATWNPVTLTPAAQRLIRMDYYNANVGYAVGRGAAIYKWDAPITNSPDARFTSSEPGCLGQLENFYSVGSSSYSHSWDFGDGATPATSTQKDPSGIIYNTAGAKLVTHIVTDGIKSDTVVQIITINPSPTATFSSKATACINEAIDFVNTSSSGPGVTYAWDFGTGAQPVGSTAQQPAGVIYSSAGSKTITLTVNNQFGCATTATQSISINSLPAAFAGKDKAICANTSIQLGTTPVSGNSYSWLPSATLNNTSISNPVATPTASTEYILTVTSTSTGCKNYDSVEITVNPSPVASFSSNAPVCQGSFVNYTNTGTTGAGITFDWDFGAGATPNQSSSEQPKDIVYDTPGTKTITFTIKNPFGCVTTAVQSIVVNSLPVAFAGLDTIICANASVQIGQAGSTGNTYTWFPPSTLSDASIANPVASPIAPLTSYILKVKNTSTGCINQDTILVTMLDPLVAYAGVDGEICRNASFQIGTGNLKGQNYTWNPAKGLSDPFIANPVASPDSTTVYTVSITGHGCGVITDNVTVTVHQLPLVDAGPSDTITKGSTIQLNASGGIQYKWYPETGLSNSGIYNPYASPDKTTKYYVTATDVFGCVNNDSMLLTVIAPNFWVPTAFTPDGNGISDVFYVRGEGIQNFECVVFNRWGEQIFISKNMEIGWDGKRQNGGEDLPEGAYVYHIKGMLSNGEIINSSGQINLIR